MIQPQALWISRQAGSNRRCRSEHPELLARMSRQTAWLPGLPSQSALLWDLLAIGIKRIARGRVKVAVPP